MSKCTGGLTIGKVGGTIVASIIGAGFVSCLGWMMLGHSLTKLAYAGNDSYELSFPAYVDCLPHSGDLRDDCIERIRPSSEVAHAFWGTPGVLSIGGDTYIYVAFKTGSKHGTEREWQKRIDGMFEKQRNQYRPRIGEE